MYPRTHIAYSDSKPLTSQGNGCITRVMGYPPNSLVWEMEEGDQQGSDNKGRNVGVHVLQIEDEYLLWYTINQKTRT